MMVFWRRRQEAIVSVLVLLAVCLVLFALLATPLMYHAERYRSELRKDARMLQELKAIEAVQEEISQVQHSYQVRNLHKWIYSGRNVDEISLDVQRRISEWLEGAQLQRVTPQVVKVDSDYTAVGVQVQFVATLDQLLGILEAIEDSKPMLVVERMRVSPQVQRLQRNQVQPPQRVSVQMTVQTYVATGAGA